MNRQPDNPNDGERELPIAMNEDIEYSRELADQDDVIAQERAREADKRARQEEG